MAGGLIDGIDLGDFRPAINRDFGGGVELAPEASDDEQTHGLALLAITG